MNSQAEIIIAFVYKRSGKTELSFSDIYLTLSMELNWFTPEGAKKFVNDSIENNFLTKKNDQLRPSFDILKIDIPIGYSPTGKLFDDKKEIKEKNQSNIFDKILDKIEKETKKDKVEIKDKIQKISKEKNITKEVAGVLFGKEYNIKFNELYKEMEKEL